MKKNVRNLIIAASAAAVLGGVLAAVMLIPDSKEINESDNRPSVIFNKTDCVPEMITVKNRGGEFELLAYDYSSKVPKQQSQITLTSEMPIEGYTDNEEEDIYVEYTMQDHEDLKLSKTLTDKMYEELRNITALKTIDKSSSKYSEYGLDEPESTVSVTFSDNSSYTIDLGNESPEGEGAYIKIGGDENVYLVDKNTITCFYFEKLQMFDKSLGREIEDVTSLTLGGTAYSSEINIGLNTASCYSQKYKMDGQDGGLCDDNRTDEMISNVEGCHATWISAIDVTDEDIRKYGLDKPYKRVKLEGSDGSFVEIIAGSPDEENKFYLMNTGGKIIYQSDPDESPWYGADRSTLLTDNVFGCIVNMTESLEVTYGGKTEKYTVTRIRSLTEDYTENYTYRVSLGDKTVAFGNYSQFIGKLSEFERTGEKPASLAGCTESFRAKLSYRENETLTDEIIIYKDKNNKAVFVLNGRIVCYVDPSYADEVSGFIPELSKIYE